MGHGFEPWSRKIPHAVNEAHVPQLLSQRIRARVPQLLSPRATATEARVPRARAPQQEKPPQQEACAPQLRVAPAHCN